MSTPLGVRLRETRERLGLSRSELARRAEIGAAQLFRIENSDDVDPTFARIARLSEVLGVSLDWLAGSSPTTDEPKTKAESFVLDETARRSLVAAHSELSRVVETMKPTASEKQSASEAARKTTKKPK